MAAEMLALREPAGYDQPSQDASTNASTDDNVIHLRKLRPLSGEEKAELFDLKSKGGYIRALGLAPFGYAYIAAEASKSFNCEINVDNVQSVLSDLRALSRDRALDLIVPYHAERWL